MELFLFLIFLWTLCGFASSTNCRKELQYHNVYGYGYDIYCEKLTNLNVQELMSIEAYNEVFLSLNRANISALNPDMFRQVKKLRELVITNSTFAIPQNETIFEALPQLEKVTLSANNITVIQRNIFKSATNVKDLNLFSNRIHLIEKDSFKDFERLKVLNLENNKLRDIRNIPYCEIPSLEILILKNNSLSPIMGNNTFSCLPNLHQLHLDYNLIENLGNSFNNLVSLTYLGLSYNSIRILGTGFANDLNLVKLNLEGNLIKTITDENFKGLSNLQELNLRNNLVEKVHPKAFENAHEIRSLNLENNRLQNITFNHLLYLEEINLGNNNFSVDNLFHFKDLFKIKTLILSRNYIGELQGNLFANLKTLKHLDLSYNKIKINSKSFFGLNQLEELHLRNSSLSKLDTDAFNSLRNLRHLDLSGNSVSSIENTTFANLLKLEVLNVSYNNLIVLDHVAVTHLYSLKILDLEGNQLTTLDYTTIINEVQSLQIINVKENLLSCHFLGKMIPFLKSKQMNISISENFKYDKENVEGIYCKETEGKINISLEETRKAIDKNSRLLNELYNITVDSNQYYSEKISETVLICIIGFSLLLVFLVIFTYKGYGYYKKRNYMHDELELITREK